MSEAPALKACPFCGGSDLAIGMRSPAHTGVIRCDGCGASILADDEPEAIAAWNRRCGPKMRVVAHITAAGLERWLSGSDMQQHALLRSGNNLRVPLYADTSNLDHEA